MTNLLNPDSNTPKTGVLPFASGELDRSGLRLTRAEFARFLGVSKQAVGEWVTSGKISLGADGRLDPRQAVSQLLRNSDPARLRAKVLAPLVRDVGVMQKRVADLERALAAATEDASFHEESASELVGQWNDFDLHLREERDVLVALPADKVIDGIIEWLKQVADDGTNAQFLTIFECTPGNGLDISQRELDSLGISLGELDSLNATDNLPIGALDLIEEGGEAEFMEPTQDEIASLRATATHDDE